MPRGISEYDRAQLQGRLWTPNPATSPAWFDPLMLNSLTFSGANITGARNLSNNGFDLASGSCGYDAIHNGFSFNGSQSIASTATRSLGVDFAIVCEINPASATQSTITSVVDWDHASGGGFGPIIVQTESGDVNFYFGYSNGTSFFFVNSPKMGALTVNKWSICTMFVQGGTAWNFLNGNLAAGFPRTGGGSVSANARRISLGNAFAPNNNRYFTGRIGSVRVFTAPSLANAQLEEGRLAWRRFGLTADQSLIDALAASHPFKNRPPLIGD